MGQYGDRRRADNLLGFQQWRLRRNRQHTARTAHPWCCADKSVNMTRDRERQSHSFLNLQPKSKHFWNFNNHFELYWAVLIDAQKWWWLVVDTPYRAGASLWVTGVRMTATIAQLAVAEVESSSCAGVTLSAILMYRYRDMEDQNYTKPLVILTKTL